MKRALAVDGSACTKPLPSCLVAHDECVAKDHEFVMLGSVSSRLLARTQVPALPIR